MTADDITRRAFGRGRVTPQRTAIARAASGVHGAFTVEELAEVVRRSDPAAGATATVYRAVAAMEASGFLERVGAQSGSALYARCGDDAHHHHIVCDGCGRIAHAECPLETTSASEGFIITRHEVALYGLCPTCAASGRGA